MDAMEATERAEWWERGYDRGHLIGEYADLPSIGDSIFGRVITDADELQDDAVLWASEAEEHDRQYSPFEFTARELNSLPDPDEAWAEFDDGIWHGIRDSIRARLAK